MNPTEMKKMKPKTKTNKKKCECCGVSDKSVGLATGENGVEMWVCRFCDVDGSNYNGWGDVEDEEEESGSDDEEMPPHCYKCFNMNMSINVNCFACDKLYCKRHSYCILGDDDMPYCSKECFLNS